MEAPQSEVPVVEPSAIQTASNPPVEVDEVVVFNKATLIYHQPHCFWAKKCTKNCVYIRKNEAINLGGRAAKSCNPR